MLHHNYVTNNHNKKTSAFIISRLFYCLVIGCITNISLQSTPYNRSSIPAKIISQSGDINYVGELSYGTTIRRNLGNKRRDVYYIDLKAGVFFKVIAEQRGVDLTIKLFTSDNGDPVEEADSPTGTAGTESITYVTEFTGRYRIEIHSLEHQGEYQIKMSEMLIAGERERLRSLASHIHQQAINDSMSQSSSYDKEILLEKEAITLLERLSLPNPVELAASLSHLGELYRQRHELSSAMEYLNRALKLQEIHYGKESTEVALVLEELGKVNQTEAKLDEAELQYQKGFDIRLKANPGSVDTALSQTNIATIQRERGNYKKAHDLYKESLEILERQLPENDPDFTLVLVPFGELCRITADYDNAEIYFKRSLKLYESAFGTDHHNIPFLLDSMAVLYVETGNFELADIYLNRIQKLLQKRDQANLDVVAIKNNLGKRYFDRGLFAEAEIEFKRVLQVRRETLGEKHPLVATSLNNLGALYSEQDLLVQAEDCYNKALAICHLTDGSKPSSSTADILSNVGSLYIKRGDYREAANYYQRALDIREELFTQMHPTVAASLNQLATALSSEAENARRGQYEAMSSSDAKRNLESAITNEADAEKYLRQALQIQEAKLHPEHPAIATTLFKLGVLNSRQRRNTVAENLFYRALKINRKCFGQDHPYAGRILNKLANLYRDQKSYKQAGLIYQQSLSIQEPLSRINPQFLIELLRDYATYNQQIGNHEIAVKMLEQSMDLIESSIDRNLGIGSERQKLIYLANFKDILDQIIELDEHNHLQKSQSRNLAFLALLRLKGRGLDEMVEHFTILRSRATQGERVSLEKLRSICSAMSALIWRDPDSSDPTSYKQILDALNNLQTEREKVEAEVSKINSNFLLRSSTVSIARMRERIAIATKNTALLEFVVYNKRVSPINGANVKHYAAYVFTSSGEPLRIDLGDAAIIDRMVDDLRITLVDSATAESTVKQKARQLDRYIMQPIRDSLSKDTHHLLISPDGALNLIPFSSLVDQDNQYLIKRYLITYLTSGRDLLRLERRNYNTSPPLLIGDPAYGRRAETELSIPANSRRTGTRRQAETTLCDISQIPALSQLTEAKREVESIKKLLPNATLLTSKDATTNALREIQSPEILHIATHGIFLCRGRIKNPLLRSGLAMAGFNQQKSENNTGVIMAIEVATLNLEGTKLAVLSACETGLGDVQNGEGVQGLRRALVLAGSASQVISLWKVSTYKTRILMTDFYTKMVGLERLGRGEALRQVQLESLRCPDRRHPFYWAGFIQSGEWTNLDGV